MAYLVIIIILLTVVFLSQQLYFNEVVKKLYFQAETQTKVYWTKATDWFNNNVYPMVSREVEQKSTFIQQEINKQKNNVVQNIWEKTKNYFKDIFSKVSGTQVQ